MKYQDADRIAENVVAWLCKKRGRQGLSLTQLAKKSGLHRTTIDLIEKGERTPSLVSCIRIASALGIPLWQALKESLRPDGRAP